MFRYAKISILIPSPNHRHDDVVHLITSNLNTLTVWYVCTTQAGSVASKDAKDTGRKASMQSRDDSSSGDASSDDPDDSDFEDDHVRMAKATRSTRLRRAADSDKKSKPHPLPPRHSAR